MAKDPNLFKPRLEDQIARIQNDAPAPWEWWYFDAISDDGYALSDIWLLPGTPKARSPFGCVSLDVVDPDGKVTTIQTDFEEKVVSFAYDRLEVTAGKSYLRGEWPKFEIHHEFDGGVLDIVFESLTQGVMEPPNGCFIGRDQPPATKIYMGWVVTMPRAKVTGTLNLEGEEIPFRGMGYHDHQWGPIELVADLMMQESPIFDYWYWGRIHLPEHTLIYWDGQLRPELGSVRHKRLIVLEGEKLVEYLSDHLYTEAADIVTDPATGVQCPEVLVQTINSDTIQGLITMKKIRDMGTWIFPPRSGYIRHICDCEAKLNIFGKKVDATTVITNELMMFKNRE